MGILFFSFLSFWYYKNSLRYVCTAFIIRKKKPCYFWRKQNLRGQSDFALFVLCSSGGINSLILAQGTLNTSVQTHKSFSETIQCNCSQSGHMTTQTFCPCVGSAHPSIHRHMPGTMAEQGPCVCRCAQRHAYNLQKFDSHPKGMLHDRKADMQTKIAVWYNRHYTGGMHTAGETKEKASISLRYSKKETFDLGLEGWRSSRWAGRVRYARLSNGRERERGRLCHHWYPKNCKVHRRS